MKLLALFTVAIAGASLAGISRARLHFSRLLMAIFITAPIVSIATYAHSWRFDAATEVIAMGNQVKGGRLPGPLIILLFDELGLAPLLRGNAIDDSRFPSIAEFSRNSIWYRQARATSIKTGLSIPAFLSGRGNLPEVPIRAAYGTRTFQSDNLLTELSSANEVHVVSIFPHDCLSRKFNCAGVDRDGGVISWGIIRELPNMFFSWILPARAIGASPIMRSISLSRQGILISARDESVSHAIALMRDAEPGHAYYVHVLFPHEPYIYGRGARPLPPPHVVKPGIDLEALRVNYLEQVGYADEVFGQIVEALTSSAHWNKSTVIFLADHGYRSRFSGRQEDEALRVPLMIRSPGQIPTAVDSPILLSEVRERVLNPLLKGQQAN